LSQQFVCYSSAPPLKDKDKRKVTISIREASHEIARDGLRYRTRHTRSVTKRCHRTFDFGFGTPAAAMSALCRGGMPADLRPRFWASQAATALIV
jgi:hypothetical protein